MAGLLSSRLIGSPAAAESRACPRPPNPPRTGSRRRSVGCYCSSRNDGNPPQAAEVRVRITPCFTNRVYEDRAKGIVCYRDGNGEVVCEGFDEGPRPAAPCPARDQEVDVIKLLERSWLQLETGSRRSAEHGSITQAQPYQRISLELDHFPGIHSRLRRRQITGLMWWRSPSFILDKQQHLQQPEENGDEDSSYSTLTMTGAAQNPNPNSNISAYYQTRAAHHGVVTSDWLAQAQAAVGAREEGSDDGGEVEVGQKKKKVFDVIDEFNNWRKQPDLAEAVAAIRALASVIRSIEASTMMELEVELKKASDCLKSWDRTSISLTAGCDLFMRYVTRTSALEYENFSSAKARLIERAEKFGEISHKARKIIAMLSQDFIFDGCTILVHGFSRVVLEVLKLAAANKKLFRVFCTEGRPDRTGLRVSNEMAKLDVPVRLILDSAVAYTMDEVDMVLVGADGVVESGGIINVIGTYQIALVAHSMNKPVYVAAESYKFARLYPLDQKDMVPALRPIDFGVPIPSKVEVETSARDYTPPQYLSLLFTDLGVLTPSVVSDELIQLYL